MSTIGTMTRGKTLLFAVAGATAVGNLYWAQPLFELIAADLGVSTETGGLLVTATQVGYALGIFLVVPLGDVLSRRWLVPALMAASAAALVAATLAPSFLALAAALFAVGLTTVAGQLLIPLAADLAEPVRRGQVVGTIVAGILIGILVARTVSGLVAGLAGWRAVYVMATVLTMALALLVRGAIPALAPRPPMSYAALIRSVFAVVARHRSVRWTLAIGASVFGAFTMFWTALTFLLAAPPYSYSVTMIGLFGLVGVVGAVAAQRAGALHDRGWDLPATGLALTTALLAWVLAAALGRTLVGIVVVTVLFNVAAQVLLLLCQTRLFGVAPEARSRLNTAFVTVNFIGGAIGSALASALWSTGGWVAVALAGAGLAVVGLGVWASGRRGPKLVAAGRAA